MSKLTTISPLNGLIEEWRWLAPAVSAGFCMSELMAGSGPNQQHNKNEAFQKSQYDHNTSSAEGKTSIIVANRGFAQKVNDF